MLARAPAGPGAAARLLHAPRRPAGPRQRSRRAPRALSTSLLAVVLCLVALLRPALAHTIDLAPGTKECFFEARGDGSDLHTEDRMSVTYQVAGGGHLDIDFWVTDPRLAPMYTLTRKDTGTYSFTAEIECVIALWPEGSSALRCASVAGRYQFCFSNEMSTVAGKTVSFNVHGVMYIEDVRLPHQASLTSQDGHTAPIEKEIRALSAALEAVKDEQEYIVVRERLHRDTAESTNDRVKWWGVAQAMLLVSTCAFQVLYLRRFFETKSRGRLV